MPITPPVLLPPWLAGNAGTTAAIGLAVPAGAGVVAGTVVDDVEVVLERVVVVAAIVAGGGT